MSLEQLIDSYGPVAVFAGCFFEGETAAIMGGILAHRGTGLAEGGLRAWAGMWVVAATGAWLADQGWFLLARHAPARGPIRRLRERAAESRLKARLQGARHVMAFAFRFVPGARIVGPVLLAQTDLRWMTFAALNTPAVLLWAAIFTAIGYHFGLAAEAALGRLSSSHWLWFAAGVVVCGLVLHQLIRRRARRR